MEFLIYMEILILELHLEHWHIALFFKTFIFLLLSLIIHFFILQNTMEQINKEYLLIQAILRIGCQDIGVE